MRSQTAIFRSGLLAGALLLLTASGFSQVTFRYFYDNNGQLFRALDSTGNLVEYDYDLAGNPTQVVRSFVAPGSLSILSLNPSRGLIGQTIAIYGQNFSNVAAGDTVKFNGVNATVLSASTTTLVAQVPAGVTTGPVTVTVNGVTVSSGTLVFTVPAVPTITSIAPGFGSIGQTLTGVTVQGTNLDGATFDLGLGGSISNVNIVNSNQATFNLLVGQFPGRYTLTANANNGLSSSLSTPGNTFYVFFAPGNNTAVTRFSTFNTSYPLGFTPNVPTGSNEVDRRFSTFNTAYPPGITPNVPAGSNEVDRRLSVFNTFFSPGTNPFVPAGSNEAFRLFSTSNTNPAGPVHVNVSAFAVGHGGSSRQPAAGPRLPFSGTGEQAALVAGQTLEIAIDSTVARFLQFTVNGVLLASSSEGSLNTLFTVPSGMESIELRASGRTESGLESETAPQRIRVIPDSGHVVSGRVLDENGQPAAGAAVTWQANGLAVEYFRLSQPPNAVPDFAGLSPARMAYISALNFPNPQQVFGKDPLGAGLGANYAARFHGRILAGTEGVHQFVLRAHGGARLSIDGQRVAEAGGSGSDFAEASGSIALAAGAHEIEVIYFESAGASILELFWTKPGGSREILSPEALQTDALPGSTAVTGNDGRFRLNVPDALDGLQLRVTNGRGTVSLDRPIAAEKIVGK